MRIAKILSSRNENAFGNPPARIVCLGDSVTHGCFEVYINRFGKVDTVYDSTKSYVRLLQDQLLCLYPASAVSVINSGISGDGTTGALERFARDVAPYSPDLVTVNLGLNDCMAEDTETALRRYKSNMKELFYRIRSLGAEAILVTPNMMCTYVDPVLPEGVLRDIAAEAARRQNDGTLDRFVNAARQIAEENLVSVADTYAVWQAYAKAGVDTTALLANRINHPAAALHDLFVQKILANIFE